MPAARPAPPRGRLRQPARFAGRPIPASTITCCEGTGRTEGPLRPRSPECRMARRSGHLVPAVTRAVPYRPTGKRSERSSWHRLGHESGSAAVLAAGTSHAIGKRLSRCLNGTSVAPEFTPKRNSELSDNRARRPPRRRASRDWRGPGRRLRSTRRPAFGSRGHLPGPHSQWPDVRVGAAVAKICPGGPNGTRRARGARKRSGRRISVDRGSVPAGRPGCGSLADAVGTPRSIRSTPLRRTMEDRAPSRPGLGLNFLHVLRE